MPPTPRRAKPTRRAAPPRLAPGAQHPDDTPAPASAGPVGGAALAWDTYVDGLVAEHGSLAALAEQLAAHRGHVEDVESVARALRRLRARGTHPGGVWGDRVLSSFGLPTSVDARLRFMGQYHSRFADLPVPLGLDLVQLWDRPPTNQSREARVWLSLARATLALRARRFDDAAQLLVAARRLAPTDPRARVELALALGVLETRAAPHVAGPSLAAVPQDLAALAELVTQGRATTVELDCLRARYVGQEAHALHHRGEHGAALGLHAALPDQPTTHPFARSRRANGLAFAEHGLGDDARAIVEARRAATFAGDAGHVRLRAMALLMIARVAPDASEADDARARARAIADALDEPTLRARVEASARDRRAPRDVPPVVR